MTRLGQRQQTVRVGPVRGGGLTAVGEAAGGVVPNEAEQLIACLRLVVGLAGAQEARRDERRHAVLQVDPGRGQPVLDGSIEIRAQLVDVERATEDAEPPVETLDLRREQVVAPVHRRSQAATAVARGRCGRCAGAEPRAGRAQLQAGVEAVEQLVRGEQAEHRPGELDGEREAVEPPDDPGEDGGVGRGQRDRRPGGRGALEEQPHRRGVGHGRASASSAGRSSGSMAMTSSSGRASGVVDVTSTRRPSIGARRSATDRTPSTTCSASLRTTRAGWEPSVARQLAGKAILRDVGDADPRGQGLRDLVVGSDRGELDPGDTSAEPGPDRSGGLDREPRLAGATGPRERDDPRRRIRDGGDDRRQRALAADERAPRRARWRCRERRRGVVDQSRCGRGQVTGA